MKAWFYPGETFGHEFVYPKPRAAELAKIHNTPVPSMPAEMAANTTQPEAPTTAPHVVALKQAPLKAQKPDEVEVEIAEVFIAEVQDTPEPSAAMPTELPATGSQLPLIGLVGLLCLGAAGLVRVAGSRAKS